MAMRSPVKNLKYHTNQLKSIYRLLCSAPREDAVALVSNTGRAQSAGQQASRDDKAPDAGGAAAANATVNASANAGPRSTNASSTGGAGASSNANALARCTPTSTSSASRVPAYQVCRPRSVNIWQTDVRLEATNEAEVARRIEAYDNLQPARLPSYYKPTTDLPSQVIGAGQYKPVNDTGHTEQANANTNTRHFEASMTYRNLTQPFKSSKLAHPFPEPVKEMPSCTVSDQEKAAQMLADSRCAPVSSQRQSGCAVGNQSSLMCTLTQKQQVRNYSSSSKHGAPKDPKKCKKAKCGPYKKCTRYHLENCEPAKTLICEIKEFDKCKKKLAPYPSYSEACVEEPYHKPSECRSCPYHPRDHPTFKAPKKKYHTTTAAVTELAAVPNDTSVLGFHSHRSSAAASDLRSGQGARRSMSMASNDQGSPGAPTVGAETSPVSTSYDYYYGDSDGGSFDGSSTGNMGLLRKKPPCKYIPDPIRKKPCGWVEGDRADKTWRQYEKRRKRNEYQEEGTRKSAKAASVLSGHLNSCNGAAEDAVDNVGGGGISLARKNKPCPRPNIKRCPDPQPRRPSCQKKAPPKKPRCGKKKCTEAALVPMVPAYPDDISGVGNDEVHSVENGVDPVKYQLGQSIDVWLMGLNDLPVPEVYNKLLSPTSVLERGLAQYDGTLIVDELIRMNGTVKKFPFKPSNFSLVRKRKPTGQGLGGTACPKKKIPLPIRDCPGDKKEDCRKCNLSGLADATDVMFAKSKGAGKQYRETKPGDKCKEEEDDPCGRKSKGITKVCPSDLLETGKKKRKPKKKAAGLEMDDSTMGMMLNSNYGTTANANSSCSI